MVGLDQMAQLVHQHVVERLGRLTPGQVERQRARCSSSPQRGQRAIRHSRGARESPAGSAAASARRRARLGRWNSRSAARRQGALGGRSMTSPSPSCVTPSRRLARPPPQQSPAHLDCAASPGTSALAGAGAPGSSASWSASQARCRSRSAAPRARARRPGTVRRGRARTGTGAGGAPRIDHAQHADLAPVRQAHRGVARCGRARRKRSGLGELSDSSASGAPAGGAAPLINANVASSSASGESRSSFSSASVAVSRNELADHQILAQHEGKPLGEHPAKLEALLADARCSRTSSLSSSRRRHDVAPNPPDRAARIRRPARSRPAGSPASQPVIRRARSIPH